VDVATLLSPPLLSQLRIALGPQHRVLSATEWPELNAEIRRNPVDVVVVDPSAGGPLAVAQVIGLRSRYPSLPVVLYLVLSPATLRAVVELAKYGIHQVVLHRFDDEASRLRELLVRQSGDALTERLLDLIAGPLAQLQVSLAGEIRQMFRAPHGYVSAQDLASAAGLPRRTMYRQLLAAGFSSPRLLVQAARMLRAYLYLNDPGNLVEDVVAKMRYGSSRIFVRHARETSGLNPSALRQRVGGDEFIARLAARLVPVASTGEAPPTARDGAP
jgi:AraC-like DNA-binding protein